MFYEDHYTAHPSSSSLLLPLHKIFWYIVACGTFLDKYIFLYIFLHFKQTISKKYFLVFDSFKLSMVLRSMFASKHKVRWFPLPEIGMLCFTLQYNHFTGWRQFNLDTVKNAVWGRQMFIRLDVPGPRLQSPSIYIPDNFTTN